VTDGDAIHAKILAEPDEDVHRLAYADWLDEQGDPARAEFIRVGCELARTPETVEVVEDWPVEVVDGDAVRVAGAGFGAGFGADAAVTYALRGDTLTTTRRAVNPEYKRLCDRRNELLEAFRPEWILPTPFTTQAEWDALDALSPPGVCTFRRGFVEAVTCSGDDWARHGDAVLAAHPVRGVAFTDGGPEVSYWFTDFRIQQCRHAVAGRVVVVPERDAALARGDREVTCLVLSARWPRIPPEGWAFAPPQDRVHGTVIDENGNWVVVSRADDGRLVTDVFTDPYSGTGRVLTREEVAELYNAGEGRAFPPGT